MLNLIRAYAMPCAAIVSLTMGLTAVGASIARASSPAYELIVEVDGDAYAVDTGLTNDDCVVSAMALHEAEVFPGVFVTVSPATPVYCKVSR